MFGLVPEVQNATSLIKHSAQKKFEVLAYTYGNEMISDSVIEGYPIIKELLSRKDLFPAGGKRPLLAGPDVALQRKASLADAMAGT